MLIPPSLLQDLFSSVVGKADKDLMTTAHAAAGVSMSKSFLTYSEAERVILEGLIGNKVLFAPPKE
ncbi:hypothetical protein EON65_34310 [archaeon]|nr:MAG: hypothetical protein EON65_34310 [archaeon]